MTIKEKAKAYDELLAKAKQIYNKENDVLIMHTIEDLFPQVKESEDEKIKQSITANVKPKMNNYTLDDYYHEQIVWIEKHNARLKRYIYNLLNKFDLNHLKKNTN